MRPTAVLLLALTLTGTAALALDLPEPPEGFAWREVPAIHGAFLVPDGWHFREESADGTLAYFITEQEVTPPEKFRVGATINVYRGDPSAPEQVERILRATAEEHSVDLEPGGFGPFLTLQCRVDLPATSEHPAIRVLYLGVVNSKTQTTYFIVFESPVDQWERTWPVGKVIVSSLALDGDT